MPFVHVSIRTSNLERSMQFYQKYFWMKMVSRKEIPQNDAVIAFLETEGIPFRLELTLYKSQKKFEQAPYENRVFDHLAFSVKGIDELVKKMKADGVTVTDEPFNLGPTGNRIAFIEDPDGTLIELIEKQ